MLGEAHGICALAGVEKIYDTPQKNTLDLTLGYFDLTCCLPRCLFFEQRPACSQLADDAASKCQHADNKDQTSHHRHRLT